LRLPVWLKAAVAQAAAVLLTVLSFKTATSLGVHLSQGAAMLIDGSVAVSASLVLGLPSWWMPIQALFVPCLLATLHLSLPPEIFLAGFILLWLVFRSSVKDRVPLYLSDATTRRALAGLLPLSSEFSFLDLGSGLGGTLTYLAAQRPDGKFQGVESAPAPFAMSWLRLRRRANAHVRFADLWRENLSAYDVVYAFLSPDPMPDLWRKARAEMRPGALFISNSFEVPGVLPTRTLLLEDFRRTRLLIWRM
jgi:SAM-dependent methyltransferase